LLPFILGQSSVSSLHCVISLFVTKCKQVQQTQIQRCW